MGCGASSPIEPEDPMVAILKDLENARKDLKSNLALVKDSDARLRYYQSIMQKYGLCIQELQGKYREEFELYHSLHLHIAKQDANDLYEATAGLGADETKMAKVLVTRMPDMIDLTDRFYKQKYGKSLGALIQSEGTSYIGMLTGALSDFGRFIRYRITAQGERDAVLLNKCFAGMGCSDRNLMEILNTRTNAELKNVIGAYSVAFKGEDVIARAKSETDGMMKRNYGKWVASLLEFARDETEDVPDNIESCVDELYNAGEAKTFGCNEDVFLRILNKANPNTILALSNAYYNKHQRTLISAVQKKMGGDLAYAVVARLMPKYEFLAMRIYDACKGLGTDEECIARVLGCLKNDEIKELVNTYNTRYANEKSPFNSFKALMASELGGDFKDAVMINLDGQSPKGHWNPETVYPQEAQMSSVAFKEQILGTCSDQALVMLGKSDLNSSLNKELMGVVDPGAVFLNSDIDDAYDPVGPLATYEIDEYAMFTQVPQDPEQGRGIIDTVRRMNDQFVNKHNMNQQGVSVYAPAYGENAQKLRYIDQLTHRYVTDNTHLIEFCAQRDAQNVKAACEGWGADSDKLIEVLCSLSKTQLARVNQIYQAEHGMSLREQLEKELVGFFGSSSHFKFFMQVILTETTDMNSEFLEQSMKGFGTDETLLSEVICTLSNKELKAAKGKFLEKNGKTVESWVTSETSSAYQRFLLRCLKADRAEGVSSDPGLATAEANQLQNVCKISSGTIEDEVLFMDILARASPEHLSAISAAFLKLTGCPLLATIKAATSGDLETAIVCRCEDRITYYAKALDRAWKGLGTDEKATSRIFGRCSKANMKLVGEKYTQMTGNNFRKMIESETSGNYKKALVTYIFSEVPERNDEPAAEPV